RGGTGEWRAFSRVVYNARGLVGPKPHDAAATVDDVAGGGPQIAGDGVERGGLAGAVRADQREHLALAHLERHVADRDEAAETDRQAADAEHRVAHCGAPVAASTGGPPLRARTLRLSHQPCTAGTMPCGSRKTIAIISAPNTIHCASGSIASARSTSGTMPKIRPPTTGPARVPFPPVITMITMVTVEMNT